MQDQKPQRAEDHPLYKPLMAAIHQAMFGKGERHGGASMPFLDQPIFHYARMHGRGFLTGQAAKKLEEAASTRHGEAFVGEVLGAIVYAAAALLREQQIIALAGQDVLSFDRKWPWAGERSATRPLGPLPSDAPEARIDPAAWARKEEQTRSPTQSTLGPMDKLPTSARERRDPHHHKVTYMGQHPGKGHVRESCKDCADSICDLCQVGGPHRREGEQRVMSPPPSNDERVFRTGTCTCGAIDDFHSICCASLSIDRHLSSMG